jgi:hypothetical protein
MDSGIATDGTSSIFTVFQTGTYRISYRLAATASSLAASRVMINGIQHTALALIPSTQVNTWAGDAITTLTAGDSLQVQLYNLLGAVTLQGGGGGANIQIMRIN